MSQPRYNTRTQRDDWYYRIKESFRDLTGRVRGRVMLSVGFIEEPHRPEDIRDIGKCLTYLHEHQGQEDLLGNPLSRYNEFVRRKSQEFWQEMVNNGSIDAVKATMEEPREKAERLVDVNTIKHTDARDIGAEWVCLQAIRELEIDRFLKNEGWSEIQINTTLAHLITRTIYSPSELKSMRIMDENSAVCELISGNQEWRPGFQSIYKVAPSLYELKEKLESHLCQKTDDLFNITNRIAIFDLTNFYFEGRKEGSKKAQFGRSKEKRSDCKMLVLALCINKEGFIRYSSILAGNTADPDSLPDMVDTLNAKTRVPNEPKDKVLICLDAGIATEENLQKIKEKGYNYLYVSRRRLTDYEIAPDAQTVTVLDSKRQPIKLTQVKHEKDGDYYLEINSPAKQLKETSMHRQFKERFEEELQKAKESLTKKNGTKSYEKVIERVGRARQKYPSISKYYVIDYIADDPKNPKNMADIQWRIAVPENVDKQSGTYFLRTNVPTFDEKTTWDYYNLTREIECTNRQLKTDLNLRPIHHRKDDRSDAHLFLGLLSYWIVNTIRYKLSMKDIASGLPVCDKYEIGSHLSHTACISYHTALEFHGLAHQPFNEVFVKSMTRFNSFSFDDVDYTYCRQTKEIVGMMTPKGNPYVRVTDVESTLLDCFDRIDRAGGIEELLHCMEGIVLLNEERLIDYLARYDKAFLYQKTGYLLERIKEQANISESLLELCRAKGTKSVKWLTNNEESDTFVNKWRMYVPQELTSKEEYELI